MLLNNVFVSDFKRMVNAEYPSPKSGGKRKTRTPNIITPNINLFQTLNFLNFFAIHFVDLRN